MRRRPGTTARRHRPPAPPSPLPLGQKRGSGIWYLFPSYKDIDHQPDPSTANGLTNTGVSGMLWRQTWNTIQPSIFDEPNWDYLDTCFAASNAHNKYSAIQVLSGQYAPDDFFTQPEAKFITLTGIGPTTVPWDSDFQTYWLGLNVALQARYGSNSLFRHIVMAGVGQASESFLAKKPEEIVQARALAISMGFPDEVTAWKGGTIDLIDMYNDIWAPKPFCLVTGPPFGESTVEALQAMFDYGDGNYRGKFAARSHDWNSQGPRPGQISYDTPKLLAPHSRGTGGQAGNSQRDVTAYRAMLQNAYDAQLNYFEPFSNNTDNSTFQSITEEFNTKFRSR